MSLSKKWPVNRVVDPEWFVSDPTFKEVSSFIREITVIQTYESPGPCINKQKSKKNLDFYYFTSFWLFIFEEGWKCTVTSKGPVMSKKPFVGILSATDEKSMIRIRKSVLRIVDLGPHQIVTDPQHQRRV